MAIHFSAPFKTKTPSKKKLKEWLLRVAASEGRSIKNLRYTFCSDEALWQLNYDFLKHDTYTDIITFDYSERENVSGEIYISVERITENAQNQKVSFEEELLRVLSHGLLHLCGYKDKKPEEQKKMRRAENKALDLFQSIRD